MLWKKKPQRVETFLAAAFQVVRPAMGNHCQREEEEETEEEEESVAMLPPQGVGTTVLPEELGSLPVDEEEYPSLSMFQEDNSSSLGSLASRRQRRRPPGMSDFLSSPPAMSSCHTPADDSQESPAPEGMYFSNGVRRPRSLNLATPSSCSSLSYKRLLTPGTPQPERGDLKLIAGDVEAILFDFDGTLTASPGDLAQRCRKQVELRERAPLLAPRLRALREAGFLLGIISKSSEFTIRQALKEAALTEFFDGPLLAKAVGLEGKAGIIEDLVRRGTIPLSISISEISVNGTECLQRVMLVDDDLRELDRARTRGIQTFAAPKEGGLQEEDFDEIFTGLGLVEIADPDPNPMQSALGSSANPSPLASANTIPSSGHQRSPELWMKLADEGCAQPPQEEDACI
eukprot:gnl/TRDRNA2_/TRDRNA2_163520_c0_seq1.p1 gnl/TRDRNA2_/TRDRNA2_163520_c0~~gnl/TRDRNA2_/TRDRNA2_163520_c0_seq1.p1  ORF type:complete len:402 (+),score=87.49 gnl/TRDRNA2_/TRDRNA2_163520_c0_seq1:1273-2478(+)